MLVGVWTSYCKRVRFLGLLYSRIVTCTWSNLYNSVSKPRGSCIYNMHGEMVIGRKITNHELKGARDNNEKAVVVSYMPYSGCVREFDIFIMRPHGTQNQLIRTSGVGTLNKELTFSLIHATAYLKEGFD